MRLVLLLIVFMAAFRWIPHPWNVAPNMALAIVAGFYLTGSARFWVPAAVIIVGDLGLVFTNGYGWSNMTITPLSLVTAAIVTGTAIKLKAGLGRGALLALGGSTLFFVLSNLMVWGMSTMYAHTFEGLVQCFVMALPFYKSALIGDLAFTIAMVGIVELARLRYASQATADL